MTLLYYIEAEKKVCGFQDGKDESDPSWAVRGYNKTNPKGRGTALGSCSVASLNPKAPLAPQSPPLLHCKRWALPWKCVWGGRVAF